MSADDRPRAHGEAVLEARIRSAPEDFFVEELDAFAASGAGEHLLVDVRKRGMTTQFAATRLAQWAGVETSAIGYAGMKDRHAVTRQRFSVHLPKRQAPETPGPPDADLEVQAQAWHSRKLPRGAHAGNRFVLVLRDVRGEVAAIDARLAAIAGAGVANYYGVQRFGRDGGNVAKAMELFAGRRVRRDERTHLLSAARSTLFNQVAAARVRAGNWDRALDGEVWMLEGTHSVFGPEPLTEALRARLAAFDIHPTGPLWGRGELRTRGEARALEEAALGDATSQALRAGLERAGMAQERRALRLRPRDFAWHWDAPHVLRLEFALPPGGYATTVLDELGVIDDAGPASAHRSSD